MSPLHPAIQPKVISGTSPTPLSTAPPLCNCLGNIMCPPDHIKSTPPSAMNPLLTTPHGVTGDLPADPNRVSPSQPPLNLVNENGYIVFRGMVEAKDCKVFWNNVMRAWGSGDETDVRESFDLLLNTCQSEAQARDPGLPCRW